MASLADLPEIVGFFSYSREDDEAFEGTLSALREAIQRELAAQLGRSKANFRLWQDQAAIAPGKLWESEIETAVGAAVFFIPIVTPRAVSSHYCKFEFEAFLAREHALDRTDLVFPLLYISVPALENEAQWREDPVLLIIGSRQYVDWRVFRHRDVHDRVVREAIERFCEKIVQALRKPWLSREERQKQLELEAQRQAEAVRRAQEEKRPAEEDQHRAEAARLAEEEKQRAEAVRLAEDEKRRAEAARLAEEEKRAEAARQAGEEKRRAEATRLAEEEERRAEAGRQSAPETERAQALLLPENEKGHRQGFVGRHPMAGVSIVLGTLLLVAVGVLTVAGVFRPSPTAQLTGAGRPPASIEAPTSTQPSAPKYSNIYQSASISCNDIKRRFKNPMKPDEYIDAVRWLDRSESVSNLPGFFMEQNVKNACDFLLKDKSIYTYHVNFFHKNTSIGADARLDNGRCLIVIDNVSC